MSSGTSNRGTVVVMLFVASMGLIIGFTAAPIDTWGVSDWTGLLALALGIVALIAYLVKGRDPLGQVPTDEKGLRRWRTWSIVGIIAMVLVIALNIGTAVTSSWTPSSGFVFGIWLALAVLFSARLRQLRKVG